MNDKLRVGVIGLGFMGATHVAAYGKASDRCELIAVCDRKVSRRSGQLHDVGGNLDGGQTEAAFDADQVRGYETPDEFFADPDLDLVSICTRTDTHVELACAAMRAGKHVLLEKPVALHEACVAKVAEVASETGRVCMPAMCMRFWPGWTELSDAVRSGAYGQLHRLRLTRVGPRPAWSDFYADNARSGGALCDLHVHDTDFVCSLFGQPVEVISTGSAQHVSTIYRVSHPAHVVAEGGWIEDKDVAFTMKYVADFSGGSLDFDLARVPTLRYWAANNPVPQPMLIDEATGYERQVAHLLESLQNGKPPAVTIDDALVTHRVLDAERKSLLDAAAVAL